MIQAQPLICAALRGMPGAWRDVVADPAAGTSFLAASEHHRVRPLLAWRLHGTGELPAWPAELRDAFLAAARAEAAIEITRRVELRRLLEAFAAGAVPVLLMKGAALAYSVYPEPWLRPREDSDLLVRGDDAARARGILAAAGYRPTPMQRGEWVSHQQLYLREGGGRQHACDLHWKIANPVAFADLMSADDLLRDAASISLDGVVARIPARVDALLLACWHRVSHHHDSDNLLWLYDLHLLADGLGEADTARLLADARRTQTLAVCARGLSLARECFGTRLPSALSAALLAGDTGSPPAAAFLERDARKVDLLAADLRALPGWRSRVRLVREHLFPPADYMFATSGHSARALLPALYLRRIARGAGAWFRRPSE